LASLRDRTFFRLDGLNAAIAELLGRLKSGAEGNRAKLDGAKRSPATPMTRTWRAALRARAEWS